MSVDDLTWLANDTTPILTWDDILRPNGVTDSIFGVVTPDPRPPNHDALFGIIEFGLMLIPMIFIYTFYSQKN